MYMECVHAGMYMECTCWNVHAGMYMLECTWNVRAGMYMECTCWNVQFVFNNQTVLILLLLVKTVCGIDLLSFNKNIAVYLNPINSLVHVCAHVPIITCSDMSHRHHVPFFKVCIRVAM